mgnify:CR=1 FL=1
MLIGFLRFGTLCEEVFCTCCMLSEVVMAKKIMTVDDSPTIRMALSASLIDGGYEVVEATDGADAIRKLASEDVEMMITDLNMPHMDGIELIRKVRGDGKNRFLPIIMLTTESENEKKKEGRLAGASGWVVKPFTPSQLLAVVKVVCPA